MVWNKTHLREYMNIIVLSNTGENNGIFQGGSNEKE